MIADLVNKSTPNPARVIEIADEFFFLCINADLRLTGCGKTFSRLGDIFELPIAIWMLRFRKGLAITFQRKVQLLLQQSRDGSWARRNFPTLEFTADFTRALSCPFERFHRITS